MTTHTRSSGARVTGPPCHNLFEDGEEAHRDGECLTDPIAGRSVGVVEEHAGEEPSFPYTAFNGPPATRYTPPPGTASGRRSAGPSPRW